MPSRIWYWVAAALVLAGAGGATLFLMPRLAALQHRLVRVVVPGTAELALDRPGSYTVFHEPRSVVDGRLYYAANISGLALALHSSVTGRSIRLTPSRATTKYTLGGRSGTSIFTFEIAQPGNYRLTAGYAGGRAGPRTVLAVGQGMVGGIFAAILGAIGIGLGAFAAAVAIASITLLKRRAARRAAASG